MVTRLDHQKGVDLAFEALESNLDESWQFVLLGTGDPGLEDRAQSFAAAHADRASAVLRFDPQLARQIYGGSDVILIPSRYEPSGLSQMIAMRYGSVPVVRATGGLKDSVQAYAPGGKGTGFVFGPIDAAALAEVLRMTFSVFSDRRRWRGLQLRGMAKDFSWANSARRYKQLYQEMVSHRSD
jgi:starch synthase